MNNTDLYDALTEARAQVCYWQTTAEEHNRRTEYLMQRLNELERRCAGLLSQLAETRVILAAAQRGEAALAHAGAVT